MRYLILKIQGYVNYYLQRQMQDTRPKLRSAAGLMRGLCLLGLVASEATLASAKSATLAKGVLSAEEVREMELRGSGPLLRDGQDLTVDVASLPQKVANNEAWGTVGYEVLGNDYHTFQVKISDTQNTRFEVPEEAVSPKKGNSYTHKLETYGISLTTSPFSLEMHDVRDPTNWFVKTQGEASFFFDKYVEFGFQLPTQRIYGFGERTRTFGLTEGAWQMWARDGGDTFDDGSSGLQSFGVHPFLLVESKKAGDFFGIYFHNSNLQSPVVNFNEDGTTSLHYITIGGNLEIYMFTQGSAEFIIQQYHDLIGKPGLPPFYGLGFYQGSEQYDTTAKVTQMVNAYKGNKIPLEGAFLNTHQYDNNHLFTVDTKNFGDASALSTALHAANQHLIPVFLPGIVEIASQGNKYWQAAQAAQAFIMSTINPAYGEGVLLQSVLSDFTSFLSYFNPEAETIYHEGMTDLEGMFKYDGAWLDMNEPTTLCEGECPRGFDSFLELNAVEADTPSTDWYESLPHQDKENTYELPFVPGYKTAGVPTINSLSLNATHYTSDTALLPSYTEYDVHNLYGHMHSRAVSRFWSGSTRDQRPFVLSRSTFPSSGMHTGHWLAKTQRTWASLRYTISGVMNFNMFGIPFTGADVCGYTSKEKTLDEELCARWYQVAAFYPFARSYYDSESVPTELYNIKDAGYKTMATDAMWLRTTLLRYYYTEMAKVHMKGGMFVKPMFFQYPRDQLSHKDYEHTFLVGDAIKVSPVIDENTSKYRPVYFPAGTWVELSNFSRILTAEKEGYQFLPKDGAYAHIREGNVFPWQDNSGRTMYTTADLLASKVALVALRDAAGQASGSLLVDDGSSQSNLDNYLFDLHNFQINKNVLMRTAEVNGLPKEVTTENRYMDKLIILNAEDLNLVDFACAYSNSDPMGTALDLDSAYDSAMKTLTISPKAGAKVEWTAFDSIAWGDSRHDMNWCSADSYQYRVASDYDLSKAAIVLVLQHTKEILPDLTMTLLRLKNDAMHLKMDWNSRPATAKAPFQPPNEMDSPDLSFFGWQGLLEITQEPFSLRIVDPSSAEGNVIFDTAGLPLGFAEYFTRFSVNMQTDPNTPGIWGLGEQFGTSIFVQDGVYTQWDADRADPVATGKLPGANAYGTHPFWMYKSTGNFVGMFYNNLNAMDHVLKSGANGAKSLVTTTTGGLIDLFVFVGASPDSVVKQYHQLIGTPVDIPRWALGWHQCRWGLKSTSELKAVRDAYNTNDLPIDALWSDIDYMENYRDFTHGQVGYVDLPAFVSEIRKAGLRYVPIVDAGVAMRPSTDYTFYSEGVTADAFIKAANGEIFTGRVWPNEVAFPDFYNPKAVAWWQTGIDSFLANVGFDGLWLDMNEASNFCTGVCYDEQKAVIPVQHNLPYVPGGRNLETKSISLDATHYNGVKELDAHSTFGYMEVKATHEWFQKNKKRTMIISRSTVPGSGSVGSAWLGDNFSTLAYMSYSVPGIMSMNMYGIHLVGPDICGFNGSSEDPELCTRWTVLGALFPFSRNHNSIDSPDQYPYSAPFMKEYEQGVTYTDVMREGIRNKYALLSYYYSEMMTISQEGGQMLRPVFYDYPADVNTWADIHNNFMIGHSLKASFVTDQLQQDKTKFYFPKGMWCNIWDHSCMLSDGEMIELSTKASDANLHLKEGAIIPLANRKQVTSLKINKADDAAKKLITNFAVNPSIISTDEATGLVNWQAEMGATLFSDDGLSLPDTKGRAIRVQVGNSFVEEKTRVIFDFKDAHVGADATTTCDPTVQSDYLGDIRIYRATELRLRDRKYITAYILRDGTTKTFFHNFAYEAETDSMVLSPIASLPVCFNSLERVVALTPFDSVDDELMANTSKKFLSGL